MKTIILVAAIAVMSATAYATSGNLDSEGCHNSKKAGYHCHQAQAKSKPAQPPKSTSSATKP